MVMEGIENGKYLVVISGPSGCGKNTVVEQLLVQNKNISVSISYTSRAMRDYEVDGDHYYFTTREEFERRTEQGLMLETVEYNGNYYGTPLPELTERLKKRQTVVLVIEVQGGMTIKKLFPDALLVFITPPSMEELENRLTLRSTETPEGLRNRLAIAQHEMTYAKYYDRIVVNNDVETCMAEIASEIESWQNSR
ncbi:MAG: guanylate kinase [Oscillospiraceae bacterium]|nr:guanylate kinase [Oscillospiraceae bacterium]